MGAIVASARRIPDNTGMPLPMTTPSHQEVLAFAACASDGWLPAFKSMAPAASDHFSKLLQGMKAVHTDSGDARSLSPPHERVLARAHGLPVDDGLIPWAAWKHAATGGQPGKAWAFITPCHWAMGREHATLTDPAALDLQEEESRTLLSDMQPYFETEGITLHYAEATCWLAEGEVFRALPTASLDRVLGRNVDPWLPGDRRMRLLQNEMQMLLYTHAVNEQRAGGGRAPVNSFWISGSGALPATLDRPAPASAISAPRQLAQAAFSDDWPAYMQAWAALDAGEGARLLALQQSGATVRLSLCGERNAMTFETAQRGFFSRINSLFGRQPLLAVLEQL